MPRRGVSPPVSIALITLQGNKRVGLRGVAHALGLRGGGFSENGRNSSDIAADAAAAASKAAEAVQDVLPRAADGLCCGVGRARNFDAGAEPVGGATRAQVLGGGVIPPRLAGRWSGGEASATRK